MGTEERYQILGRMPDIELGLKRHQVIEAAGSFMKSRWTQKSQFL